MYFHRYLQLLWILVFSTLLASGCAHTNHGKIQVDRILTPDIVLLSESSGKVLADTSVAINDGKIISVENTALLLSRYSSKNHVRLNNSILMPGFVNTHAHLANTTMSGHSPLSLGSGVNRAEWWSQISELERKTLSPVVAERAAAIGGLRMLQHGITTVNDMSFFANSVYDAVDEVGIRALLGLTIVASGAPGYGEFSRARQLTEDLIKRNKSQLIRFSIAPHTMTSLNKDFFWQTVQWARELQLPFHMHWGESVSPKNEEIKITKDKADLIAGVSGFLLAHGIHTDSFMNHLPSHNPKSAVSINISSNMYTRSHVVNVGALKAKGYILSFGTDSPLTSSRLDLFEELRSFYKVMSATRSKSPDAKTLLEWATLGGARALGLEKVVGTVEAGKFADLVLLKLPLDKKVSAENPYDQVVFFGDRSWVNQVYVAGKIKVSKGNLVPEMNAILMHHSKQD